MSAAARKFLQRIETTKLGVMHVETDLLRAALRESSIQLLLRIEKEMRYSGDRLIIQASIDRLRDQ
jgi:hypothetical protein